MTHFPCGTYFKRADNAGSFDNVKSFCIAILFARMRLLQKYKKCFRNIYAPNDAKFRFIFSVEAKPVQSK